MSFGRKGLAAGVVAVPSGAVPFGQSAPDDDIAARREAFIAAERLRNAEETGPEEPFAAQNPLINLRNMSRPARPAFPASAAAEAVTGRGGPIAEQEMRLEAAARIRASSGTGFVFGDPQGRSVGLAYVFWFILGQLSLHRLYCGQKDSAIFQVCLWVGSLVTLFIFPPIGLIGLVIWIFWLMADLFLIPGMMREFKAKHDYQAVFD